MLRTLSVDKTIFSNFCMIRSDVKLYFGDRKIYYKICKQKIGGVSKIRYVSTNNQT